MKHLGLFEGIGGFSLSARNVGWETVAWCEWNEFGQRVLKHHFPEAEGFGDITKTDFTKYANTIDIITGGFPCQPYSLAGKRKGKEDERHLWPEMLRAIREVQPRWVVGENVFGLINWSDGLVFHEVQADLEAEGYEVFPYVLPAAAVNAPHRRDRVWFVAFKNTKRNGCIFRKLEQERTSVWQQRNFSPRSTDWIYLQKRYITNANSNGQQRCNSEHEVNASKGRINAQHDIEQSDVNGDVADTSSRRMERYWRRSENRQFQTNEFDENNSKRQSRMDWEKFPTQSPICGGDDGLPTGLDGITFSKWRAESIKAYGNAIVPQVAEQIFKTIIEYEKTL